MHLSDYSDREKNLDQGHIIMIGWHMQIIGVVRLLQGYVYYALEHSKNVVHKIILFSLISHKTQVVGVFKCVYWSVNTLITVRRKHGATDTADCHYWLLGHSSDFCNCWDHLHVWLFLIILHTLANQFVWTCVEVMQMM